MDSNLYGKYSYDPFSDRGVSCKGGEIHFLFDTCIDVLYHIVQEGGKGVQWTWEQGCYIFVFSFFSYFEYVCEEF